MALTPAAKKMRKLGISLTDADLTDASSDEFHDGSAQKQAAREIEFSDPAPEAIAIEKTMKKKQVNRREDPSSCGAYRRPSGRWSSEITSGTLRMYLGTFDTMEEARRAYLSKNIEIEATKLSGFGGGDGGRGVERTGDLVVEESAKKKGKSQKPLFKQCGEWSAEIRDPIEKSEICSGSEKNGDSVVEGSPKGKRKSQRPYPGVFKRWGKWAAEVRDPFKKSKKWLGHYGSPEEARAAIIAKKLEFDARRLNIEKGESVASPCSVQAFGSVGTSGSGDRDRIGSGNSEVQGSKSSDSSDRRGGESWELAVLKRFTEGRGLDLLYVMQIASHIIDMNGNFVGEFSSLDDLQIRNAE